MKHSPSAGVGRAGETPGWWAAGPWGRWRWDSFTLPAGLVRRPGADKPGGRLVKTRGRGRTGLARALHNRPQTRALGRQERRSVTTELPKAQWLPA